MIVNRVRLSTAEKYHAAYNEVRIPNTKYEGQSSLTGFLTKKHTFFHQIDRVFILYLKSTLLCSNRHIHSYK